MILCKCQIKIQTHIGNTYKGVSRSEMIVVLIKKVMDDIYLDIPQYMC
jgi:hypothetical protein